MIKKSRETREFKADKDSGIKVVFFYEDGQFISAVLETGQSSLPLSRYAYLSLINLLNDIESERLKNV
jgi:hypothetical protein